MTSGIQMRRISIVTPCLNAEATIERMLKSIAEQNYPNLELIVCDGGSADGTLAIVESWSSLISKCLPGPDSGPANAINKGFREADGEILCWLNADDEFTPGALHHVASFFDEHPDIDVVTGGCRRVFQDGSEEVTAVGEDYLDLLPYKNLLEQPSTFWRANTHRRAGELDESFKLAFDWEWWNRLNKLGARFSRTDEVLSVYYFTGDNLTSRAGQRIVDEMYRVTKCYSQKRGVATAYWLLFHLFDMNGFYDKRFHQLSQHRQLIFGSFLTVAYALFGQKIINSYNWNWASKQIRGLTWYK